MRDPVILLKDGGLPVAWIQEVERDPTLAWIKLDIFTQDGWRSDEQTEWDPSLAEKIASVRCKWDSCCHWHWEDLYVHLCGTRCWEHRGAIDIAAYMFVRKIMLDGRASARDDGWNRPLALPAGCQFTLGFEL